MSKYYKIIFGVVLAILLFGWVASIQFEDKQKVATGLPTVGKAAPDFVLKDLQGKPVALSSFKGKLVYIKFWASWCGDCIKQVVPQRKLEESLAHREDIVFLAISVDEDEAAWQKAVERNKLKAKEARSHGGEEGQLNTNYDLDEIPRYILVGKDGLVIDNNAPKPTEIDKSYFESYL